jgi:hypothetical protein
LGNAEKQLMFPDRAADAYAAAESLVEGLPESPMKESWVLQINQAKSWSMPASKSQTLPGTVAPGPGVR